jgi:hypothetical protein
VFVWFVRFVCFAVENRTLLILVSLLHMAGTGVSRPGQIVTALGRARNKWTRFASISLPKPPLVVAESRGSWLSNIPAQQL